MADTNGEKHPRALNGGIGVADNAILPIVYAAALYRYRTNEMAMRPIRSAMSERLGFALRARDIETHGATGRGSNELLVTGELCTPILTVAKNLLRTVTFRLERNLNMVVARVNANFEGPRVSNEAIMARGQT